MGKVDFKTLNLNQGKHCPSHSILVARPMSNSKNIKTYGLLLAVVKLGKKGKEKKNCFPQLAHSARSTWMPYLAEEALDRLEFSSSWDSKDQYFGYPLTRWQKLLESYPKL